MAELQTLPARSGRAVRLETGEAIRIVNTHGSQVVDTWAFNAEDLREFMSMEHTAPDHRHHLSDQGGHQLTPTAAGRS